MAQIMPKALDYRLDARRPGYRVVTLCDAGIDCGGGKAPTSVVRQKEINTYHTWRGCHFRAALQFIQIGCDGTNQWRHCDTLDK